MASMCMCACENMTLIAFIIINYRNVLCRDGEHQNQQQQHSSKAYTNNTKLQKQRCKSNRATQYSHKICIEYGKLNEKLCDMLATCRNAVPQFCSATIGAAAIGLGLEASVRIGELRRLP